MVKRGPNGDTCFDPTAAGARSIIVRPTSLTMRPPLFKEPFRAAVPEHRHTHTPQCVRHDCVMCHVSCANVATSTTFVSGQNQLAAGGTPCGTASKGSVLEKERTAFEQEILPFLAVLPALASRRAGLPS